MSLAPEYDKKRPDKISKIIVGMTNVAFIADDGRELVVSKKQIEKILNGNAPKPKVFDLSMSAVMITNAVCSDVICTLIAEDGSVIKLGEIAISNFLRGCSYSLGASKFQSDGVEVLVDDSGMLLIFNSRIFFMPRAALNQLLDDVADARGAPRVVEKPG